LDSGRVVTDYDTLRYDPGGKTLVPAANPFCFTGF
jgi:hypothetical protein